MKAWGSWCRAGAPFLALAGAFAQTAVHAEPPVAATKAASTADAATEDHERGRAVYNFRCYFCHGYSGNARTLAATYLQPAPRDFTAVPALTTQQVLAAVRDGRDGTAMKSFRGVLDDDAMRAVAAFVVREFVRDQAPNSTYHTAANGWPKHERYAAAYPFATGERRLDEAAESLDAGLQQGRRLFMSACISCHDRARVADAGPTWSARPISFPRNGYAANAASATAVDAVSSASVYAQHGVVPPAAHLSAKERRGEALFQANCAFCHGADGTGKNWIGQFMEPKARDLTQFTAAGLPLERLRRTIRDGLPGTSMPAWRSVLTPAQVDAVAAYVSRVMLRRGE